MNQFLLASLAWLATSARPTDELKRERLPADVDFVVHIFHPTLRNFYQLERLWADAEQVPIDGAEAGA